MKLKLKVAERLFAFSTLNVPEGYSTESLGYAGEQIKQLPISAEEWEEMGKEDVTNEKGEIVALKWIPEKEIEKEVEFHDTVVAHLLKKIKARSDAGELGISDIAAVSLEKKLKNEE